MAPVFFRDPLEELIDDAKAIYAKGEYAPVRHAWVVQRQIDGVYTKICVLFAAYVANNPFPEPGIPIGKWALKHYGIDPEVGQAFLNGWDNDENDTIPSVKSEAYLLGRNLAKELNAIKFGV